MQKRSETITVRRLRFRRTLYYLDSPDESGACAVYKHVESADGPPAHRRRMIVSILALGATCVRPVMRWVTGGSVEL